MKVLAPLAAVGVTAVTATATAAAATGIEPEGGSLLDLLAPVFDAIKGGQYALACAVALVALVALVRKYLSDRVPFLKSELGAALLLFAGSFGAALAAPLATGAALSGGLLWATLGIAVGAAGGWKLLKIAHNALQPLIAKLPEWLQKLISAALFFLETPGDRERAAAEKAGKEAVEASPSNGIDGVVGKAREIP